MDQNQRFFVSTTLDREAVNRLRLGNDPAGLDSFTSVNDQRLVELAASVLRLDPEAVTTICLGNLGVSCHRTNGTSIDFSFHHAVQTDTPKPQ